MKPSELEMHNLKLLHNRIKQRIIGTINMKRVLTARDVLVHNGGVLSSSRDVNKRQRESEQEWSLPKAAVNVLTNILGIPVESIRSAKDRVHVRLFSFFVFGPNSSN